MKYSEKSNIKPWKRFEGGEKLAIVELMRIADTKTIEIYLDLTGERLYPIDFNVWGEPIFSNEVCKRILYEEECLKQIYREDFQHFVTVKYDELEIDVSIFNVTEPIVSEKIKDLNSFNEFIRDRTLFLCKPGHEKLEDLMIYGRYLFTGNGHRMTVATEFLNDKLRSIPYVCTLEEFERRINRVYPYNELVWRDGQLIPKEGECCPFCTKKFSIKDVADGQIGVMKHKMVHYSCAKRFIKMKKMAKSISE